jgi:hypothetical protein
VVVTIEMVVAKIAIMTETVAAVYQRERWFISSISEVRIM